MNLLNGRWVDGRVFPSVSRHPSIPSLLGPVEFVFHINNYNSCFEIPEWSVIFGHAHTKYMNNIFEIIIDLSLNENTFFETPSRAAKQQLLT